MAFCECHFHSNVLGHEMAMNVLIPQVRKAEQKFPVLFLLHGLGDDHTIWSRRTSIERYAVEHELVVVMPNGDRSFYTDMKQGAKYWTYISEEVPAVAASLFPISTKREETFAAGNSMGGYGALKLALRCPERFGAAVGFSSVTDVKAWCDNSKNDPYYQECLRIFGTNEDIVADGNDLFTLAEKTAKTSNPPRILQICGTEDFLYGMNVQLRDHFKKLNFPGYIYEEAPGQHNWNFWDEHAARALKFLCTNL